MRRIHPVFLLLLLHFLFSCGTELPAQDDNRSAVFAFETVEALSEEIPAVPFQVLPDGAKARTSSLLENGCILAEDYTSDRNTVRYSCHIFSEDGTLLFSVSPAADLGHDLSRDNPASGDIFSLTDAVFSDGKYILSADEGCCAYDESGTLLWKTKKSADDLLIRGRELLLLNSDGGVQALFLLDPKDGTFSAPIALSGETGAFTALGSCDILMNGKNGALYAGNAAGLYSVTLPEKSGTDAVVTMFANWMASGILPHEITFLRVLDDQTIEAATEDENGEITCLRGTMIPADKLPETEEITLALFSHRTDYHLLVFNYNKEHPENEIVIRDYTVYEGDQRRLVFNANLAAGDVPDMTLIWQHSSLDPMIPTYERAEIFADLTPLMQEDEDFRYDDLLSYVTEPFKLGEKQYVFPLDLQLSCWFGTSELFDGPMDMDGYLDLCEEKNLLPLRKMDLFSAAVDDHYDEENALCTFNDGTLLRQMEKDISFRKMACHGQRVQRQSVMMCILEMIMMR